MTTSISSGGSRYIGQAEDADHTSGDPGYLALGVRNDVLAALAGTDGDNAPSQFNELGAQYVTQGVLKEIRVTKNILIGGAYDAFDVVSEETTDTTGTDWDFAGAAGANGGFAILETAFVISQTPNIEPGLTLILFNAPPTGELDDNALNTSPVDGDLAKVIGDITFPALRHVGTSANSMAMATPSTYGNAPFVYKCASGTTTIYGILKTRDVFTQVAGDNMTVVLLVRYI